MSMHVTSLHTKSNFQISSYGGTVIEVPSWRSGLSPDSNNVQHIYAQLGLYSQMIQRYYYYITLSQTQLKFWFTSVLYLLQNDQHSSCRYLGLVQLFAPVCFRSSSVPLPVAQTYRVQEVPRTVQRYRH
jgi:hypothetical protein